MFKPFHHSRRLVRSLNFNAGFHGSNRYLKIRMMNLGLKIGIFGLIAIAVVSVFLFFWYSRDLPSPERIQRKEGFSIVVVDRNDLPLYDIYSDKNRIPIALSDIPDSVKKATVAIEDKDFYKHQGFDPKGILRSLFHIITFRGVQGGSTLTQQLVKNVLLTSERSLPRKIKEFVLAVQIERKYTKDQILQMYLNEAPYGGTMWGIESASEGYFNKHTKDLTLTESVVLAGLPQSPSYYSPLGENPKAYISRSEEVLRRMREDGYITQLQEAEFKRDLPNIKFASSSSQMRAVHFVLSVKKQLEEKFGQQLVENGGLRVTTTIDAKLQDSVEQIVREEIDKLKALKVSNGAVVVMNPKNGEILAYVGSKDYSTDDPNFQGMFDVASMGFRQPGSALKPITYAVGFMKNFTPATLLMDVDTKFPGGDNNKDYEPKNYDNKFRGPIQVRYALGNSINVPAVKMTALVGIKDILKTANDMGISSLAPTAENEKRLGLSITLGGGEVRLLDLVAAYGTFATGGIKNDPVSILKVVDSTGKTLYENKPVKGKTVIPSDISFLISDILSDNASRKEVFGDRSYLVVPGKTVAVKTGTTDDKKDNWTIGYTPSIVAGVWVGNNDNSVMDPKLASGVTGAAPIWNRIMKEALKDTKDEPFNKPDTIVQLDVDAFGGGLPKDGRPTRKEYFIKGTEPNSISPIYKKLKVSKSDNNKLANAVEIANGQYDEKEFIVFTESDPTSLDSTNRWQQGIDAWVAQQSDSSYKPPKDTSNTDENNVVVKFKKPNDRDKFDSNSFDVIIEARAIKQIKKIEFYVNDSQKKSVDGDLMTENINLDTGVYKLKAKAYDEKGNTGTSEITIGIKTDPNPTNTPVPTQVVVPTPTPVPPTP